MNESRPDDRNWTNYAVSIDGEILHGDSAAISVWDHGFLYGDGCFEGMRIYDGKLFRYPEHYKRLTRSMRILGIPDTNVGLDPLLDEISRIAGSNEVQSGHVRTIVTRGCGMPGLDPRGLDGPHLIVMAYRFPPLLGEDPISLIISSVRRKSPESIDSNVKSLNYLDSILAKTQANAAGASDALMLDSTGCIAEATGANLFIVRDGILRTPKLRAVLPGITRQTVLQLAEEAGIETAEGDIIAGDVYTADECFLTGSGAEIVPVGSVDGRPINAVGPVTCKLRDQYFEAVAEDRFTTALRGDGWK